MLTIFLLSAALATTATKQVQDQEDQEPQDDTESQAEEQEPLIYRETVVVTAAKEPQELIDATSLVTAFTKETLERSPALVIDDTLRRVTGVQLVSALVEPLLPSDDAGSVASRHRPEWGEPEPRSLERHSPERPVR